MTKILIAECKQEVATFNPQPSGYDDFTIRHKEELLHYHKSIRYEVAGALDVFDKVAGVEIVPTYSALATTSGGILASAAWQRIATEFLSAIRAAPKVDAIYFVLHGAMACEQEFDPEGYLIAETRKIVGTEIPIVASFDLHGILTERILRKSDAIVTFHTYPHVDFYETGARAAKVLLRILRGARPVTAKVDLPALVRGDELITEKGLIRESIQLAKAAEGRPDGLSAGVFIGNPFTDVPELGSYAFVTLDGSPEAAAQLAVEMAENFWSHHEKMQVPLISLDAMAAEALAHTKGTLVLVDAADATSSGACGDSNAIVRRLIEAGYRGTLLAPLVDAPAARQAFAAGVGARICVQVGGTLDSARFKPLQMEVIVRLLSDGEMWSESFGGRWNAGPTAVLQAENVTLVVSSRAVSLYDRTLFLSHGQNPRNFDAVVVKSPHCQYDMYEAWCTKMIHVDAPGASSANLRSLGHVRCRRPIFPLDAKVPFRAQPKIFRFR